MKNKLKFLGYLATWISCFGNVIIFIFKYWVALKVNSVAMRAEAWHTLSDTLTSIIVIIGFWIAAQKPDNKHPFGHGRAELFGAIIIGTLLAVVGFNFISESINKLRSYNIVHYSLLSVWIFAISVFLKEGMAQFSIRIGKKMDSKSLIADGMHHRSDGVASLIIVIGALIGKYFWWLDGVLGIFVALLILYATYEILRSTFDSLLGVKVDAELQTKIKHLVKNVTPEIYSVHHFHLHQYGDHREMTLHISLPANLTLVKAHAIATLIESNIRKKFNIEATIHVEPNK